MNRQATRDRLIGGIIGLIVGIAIGTQFPRSGHEFGGGVGGFGFGLPEILVLIVIAFWVTLIGGAVWGVGRWTRRGYSGRLEDLPADFDDWHRRAHERMRDGGADGPDRRG